MVAGSGTYSTFALLSPTTRLRWLMVIEFALGPARKYANVAAFPNQLRVFRRCFRVRQGFFEALLEHQWKSVSGPVLKSLCCVGPFPSALSLSDTNSPGLPEGPDRLCRLYVQQISEYLASAVFEGCSPYL